MGEPEIILYDLVSKDGVAWSPNPWKTRMALNYKGIPYKTEWVAYPDIEPKFKALGIPPNGPGVAATPYSIPAIQIVKSGTYIMDSAKIIAALEEHYPSPSMHLDAPITERVRTTFPELGGKMRGNLFPNVLELLPDTCTTYFRDTRRKTFGMTMDELREQEGGEAAYENAKPVLENVEGLLKEKEGPFLLGHEMAYADVYILAGMVALAKINKQVFDWIMRDFPAIKAAFDAAEAKGAMKKNN